MDRPLKKDNAGHHADASVWPKAAVATWIWTLVLLLCFVATGCNSEQSSAGSHPKAVEDAVNHEGTIVAVGDSLTAGLGVDEDQAYPARLGRRLKADGYAFKVINAGVSGETSSGALSRIQWIVSSLKPDIVILETGANDGLRGLDPHLLESNLDRILTKLQADHIQVVLAGMLMLPNLGPEYTRAFGDIYPRLAEKHHVIFMPFFLDGVAGRPDLNQSDGLHPTAQGYNRIVEKLYPYVLKAIESYRRQKHK